MKFINSSLYDRVTYNLENLKNELKTCNKALAKMPSGSLMTIKKNNHYEYYCYDGKKQKYLNSNNCDLIKSLARKKYLKNCKRYAQNEIKSLEAYLKNKDISIPSPYEYISEHEELSNILNRNNFKGKNNLMEWAQAPYDQTLFYPEGLIIRSAQGHLVRSKSECIIADALFSEGIAYRYEDVIEINGRTYRPDFKIIKPNGEVIIWEHLGMMNIEEYVNKNIKKIADYIKVGFIPGVNLILTADENSGQIIDSYKVHKLIEAYLTF